MKKRVLADAQKVASIAQRKAAAESRVVAVRRESERVARSAMQGELARASMGLGGRPPAEGHGRTRTEPSTRLTSVEVARRTQRALVETARRRMQAPSTAGGSTGSRSVQGSRGVKQDPGTGGEFMVGTQLYERLLNDESRRSVTRPALPATIVSIICAQLVNDIGGEGALRLANEAWFCDLEQWWNFRFEVDMLMQGPYEHVS